jgi:dipeptidyl aminopeptidase/acylaminoacyl peptidase
VYTVNPQEGDGELVIQNPVTKYKKVIPRGYTATITEDSKYLVFKIKPLFQDTRQARIKKKKADDMPKDTLAIIELGKDSIFKKARVKNYKTPEKGTGFIAYQLEKALLDTTKKKTTVDTVKTLNDPLIKLADSLIKKSIDSIKGNISKEELTKIINKAAVQIIKEGKDMADADGDEAAGSTTIEGTDLVLRSLNDGREKIFKLANEFYFDKNGTKLLIETTKKNKDSNSSALVLLYHLQSLQTDTVMSKFNDAKNYVFDETGNQLSFVAERDSSEKALQKFYRLWYYTAGSDSARMIADKNTVGMQLGYTVSDNARLDFSKDGGKLFFGNSPIPVPKDTTLVDFETAKLDIWNYKDDYLQPQQLKNAEVESKRSYTAVYHLKENKIVQLGAEDAERITFADEGNADWVLAETNKSNRIESQWTGRTKSTAYIINTLTAERKMIFKNQYANAAPSPAGKFVYWYDPTVKNYFTYEVATGITKNVTDKIKVPLYDIENDVPDYPGEYGVMGWQEGDSVLYVYDQFDVWMIDPLGVKSSQLLSLPFGRNRKMVNRYVKLDTKERFIKQGNLLAFKIFDKERKGNFYSFRQSVNNGFHDFQVTAENKNCNNLIMAKNDHRYVYTTESFTNSPNLYTGKFLTEKDIPEDAVNSTAGLQLSDINPQQNDYNWGTAELFTWKTYTGKTSAGIVYKPENFDPKKKYPMIAYFYEKLSDGLYNYSAPAPTASRLNIPFFVSRGYIVFAPDISYTKGHPGNDAYNYIVSGVRALVKKGFVDSTKLGIQGQSWGGYQVAYLITKTKLFAAAWAGAPVANMTSAYGGIRWESGLNRQFQYEKTQSRIGATLWEKPQLYIENSPLFHLSKVQTPLAIMSNDADGAVPWYQGIELFTALRRLGRPVWLLNYNGEAHNLVERRNRKDIQIREQQFFDWLLKGERPPTWITEGVPATEKGKNWGLKIDE